MTYSLKIWNKPNSDETRLYIGGTTRQHVYLSKAADGTLAWSSKVNDTPHKFQTGNHYGKFDKDSDAAHVVAEAYGLKLGDKGEFERALKIAQDGIEVSGDDDDADEVVARMQAALAEAQANED